MKFTWPLMLWLGTVLPVLVWYYVRVQRRHKALRSRYSHLFVGLSGASSTPFILLLLALVCLVIGSARPQANLSLGKREAIILALDVSGSMAASDIEPSRFAVARQVMKDFVTNQKSNTPVGVVIFADSALVAHTPSTDYYSIGQAINGLLLGSATAIGDGILTSLQSLFPDEDFAKLAEEYTNRQDDKKPEPKAKDTKGVVEPGSYKYGVIILLTDGQNTAGSDPLVTAQIAADKGVRVFTVGMGASASISLDEDTLRKVAEMTGGKYFRAATSEELKVVYDTLGSDVVISSRQGEVTFLFVGLGLVLLIVSAYVSLLRTGRIA